jgi:chromosome segregation ATPase
MKGATMDELPTPILVALGGMATGLATIVVAWLRTRAKRAVQSAQADLGWSHAVLEEARALRTESKAETKDLRDRLDALSAVLGDALERNHQLQAQVTLLEGRLTDAQQQIARLTSERDEYRRMARALDAEQRDLRRAVVSMRESTPPKPPPPLPPRTKGTR